MKYEAIIFDMGNVILEYVPDYFLSHFTTDEAICTVLKETIFYHPQWLDLDQGVISETEFYEALKLRLPESLHDLGFEVLNCWHDHFDENLEMLNVVKELHQKGYRLILCSNVALSFYQYKERVAAFKYFEDFVLSSEIKVIKPDLGIFEHLLKTHDLDPSACYFIDDSLANVQAAQSMGIDGYWYNGNASVLLKSLRLKGIL